MSQSPNQRPRLILVRGVPGSGKSTLAKKLQEKYGYVHFEADMYFSRDGVYSFGREQLTQAHKWCFTNVKLQLSAGRNVVVSNTFVKFWEMAGYLSLTDSYAIVECHGRFQNVHGVPQDTVNRMKANWMPHHKSMPVDDLIALL